jgi:hypothetical protein
MAPVEDPVAVADISMEQTDKELVASPDKVVRVAEVLMQQVVAVADILRQQLLAPPQK